MKKPTGALSTQGSRLGASALEGRTPGAPVLAPVLCCQTAIDDSFFFFGQARHLHSSQFKQFDCEISLFFGGLSRLFSSRH